MDACTTRLGLTRVESTYSLTSDFLFFWSEPSAVVVPCGGPQALPMVGHRVDTQHAHHTSLRCTCTAPPRGAFAGHGYEVLEASNE